MEPQVFCRGNIDPHRMSADADELALVMIYGKANKHSKYGLYGPEAKKYIAHKPFDGPKHKAQPAEMAYQQVLEQAGAWPRDEVDKRFIREVREKKGKIGRVGPRWRKIHEEFRSKQREKK